MKRLILLIVIVIIPCMYNVYASEPFTILKYKIDKVFTILNDPIYSDETKKAEQHKNLWNIVEDAFDFKAISRLTIANNWQDFSSEQQDEFARVFGRFLGNNYLDKIQSGFSNEKVEYVGEDLLSDSKAVVMTNITRNGVKTPINYSMLKTGDLWKIYDVKIEGVSLLKNYRTQFKSILMKEKPEGLIGMLKEKI
jgi:phospholipid transport system substrate-binding protein